MKAEYLYGEEIGHVIGNASQVSDPEEEREYPVAVLYMPDAESRSGWAMRWVMRQKPRETPRRAGFGR